METFDKDNASGERGAFCLNGLLRIDQPQFARTTPLPPMRNSTNQVSRQLSLTPGMNPADVDLNGLGSLNLKSRLFWRFCRRATTAICALKPTSRSALRTDPWVAATVIVTLVCTYLLFANLGHSHLWEDEGSTAAVGRTLLETGDITGWDGRNLVGCPQALCLNADGRIVLPPLMFALTAAGIAIAGDNEVGYRIAHAFCGLLAVFLLWALLRFKLPNATRLHFMIVALVSLSPQLLMYFRASRYYAFSVLAMLASLYAYERWWVRRETCWLVTLAVVTALAFLNHYLIGIAGTLSLVLVHLLFRSKETTASDYVRVTAATIPVLIACLAYLEWIGILREARWGIPDYTHYSQSPSPAVPFRLVMRIVAVLRADWISWWLFPWFAIFIAPKVWKGRASPPDSWVFRLSLVGLVGIVLSLLVEVFLVKSPGGENLRYSAFALPLLLTMKAAFVNRLWGESRFLGAAFLSGLLLTNAGAFPMSFAHQAPIRSDLAAFIAEIHRPYIDGLRLVRDFLDAHAEQDDLVHVAFAPMIHEPLVASVGNRFRFCCVVSTHGARHVNESVRQEWAAHVREQEQPDWIFSSRAMPDAAGYALHGHLDGTITSNPQRPEIDLHRFTPPPPPRVNAIWVYALAEPAR